MKTSQATLSRMERWIDEHEALITSELQAFARIRSVSRADLAGSLAPYGPEMHEMLEFALLRGAKYGFDTENHQGHCGSIMLGHQSRTIGIFGHLDVVPEGENWTWPPYAATQVDDFLIGRGVSDNKSACVLGLMLMLMYKELGIELRHGIRLVCGCSEETGMADMEYFAETQKSPEISFVPDMRFPVCYAQKGMMKARMGISRGEEIIEFKGGEAENMVPPTAEAMLTIPYAKASAALSGIDGLTVEEILCGARVVQIGQAAHAAAPENGVSAIHLLADALAKSGLLSDVSLTAMAAIAELSRDYYGENLGIACEDPETGKTTVVTGTAKTAGDRILVSVDARLSIASELDQVDKNFNAYALGAGFKMDEFDVKKPFYISKDDPKVQALMALYQEMTGDDSPAFTSGGGTYSRCIDNAITFGPGFPGDLSTPPGMPEGHGGAHAPDEYIYIPNLLRAMKIYAAAILEVDQL